MSLSFVPTLDLRDFDTHRDAFVAQIGEAYRTFGFCCFTNHGIPESLISQAYEDFKTFFALPPDIKQQYHKKGQSSRGYTPFKIETAKDQSIADLKEFYHIGRDIDPNNNPYPNLLFPNIWTIQVPSFKTHS